MSKLEDTLFMQIKLAQLPMPAREFRAIEGRRYKWDFAWPESGCRLLVEVQGGTFSKKRLGHSTGMGINRDNEKGNVATLNGWRTLSFDAKQVASGQALRWLQDYFRLFPLTGHDQELH